MSFLRLPRLATVLLLALAGPVLAQTPPPPPANCPQVNAPDLVLALRARDAARAGLLMRCRRDLAYAPEVRTAVAALFRRVDFDARQEFLDQLRRNGFQFIADFKPEYPSEWSSYGASPLRSALLEANGAGVAFLLRSPDARALNAYPALLAAAMDGQNPVREAALLQPLADAVTQLLAAGLPADFDEHLAHRRALRLWMQAEWLTQKGQLGEGHASRNWERAFSGAPPLGGAPYWKAMAERLAPRQPGPRLAAAARVGQDFVKPRLEMVAAMETTLKAMLAGPGLRQVADPRSSLGYRETEAAPGTLRDDDMVLDPYQELVASNWAAVRSAKTRLSALEALRELLTAMAPS